jgi:hypothetical protein
VLLQIPTLRERFGKEPLNKPRIHSELVWLARRIAINRERAGVHYRSDSTAGMHLALGVIQGLIGFNGEQALRDNVCEPVTTDPKNLFRNFVYGPPASLKCNGFKDPTPAKAGLLDRATAEWAEDPKTP